MNLTFYVVACCAIAVSAIQRVVNCIARAISGMIGAGRMAGRAGQQFWQTVRRHPIAALSIVVATVVAWLVVGSLPLASMLGVAVGLRIAVGVGHRLWQRWCSRRSTPSVQPQPQSRNGRRLQPALTSVS